ncbi:hypothetical protein GHU69_27120 [Pseudomonas aeruginosa]|uniref:hypothetical protein n=1 Tax=Pseudomonas aeruginosa TaxID=287 RepID=UPI0018C85249|nr:hypothetical protein [Pseudomonas aeruginosa]
MSLERMDTAANKIRRAQALLVMVQASAQQVSLEQILEAVASVQELQEQAAEALEEAYALRQKPGQAPAVDCTANGTVACLFPTSARRPS